MKREEIIESIKKIEKISNEVVQTKEKIKDEELEKYFYKKLSNIKSFNRK